MLRRAFLLGTTALTVASSQDRDKTTTLGLLAYVDREILWLRDLPDGTPRLVATGHRIAKPRFSPSGQWISFQDGDRVRVFATAGKFGREWKAGSSNWIPRRDELAISLSEWHTDDPKVFTPADNWLAPQRSIAGGDLTIDESRNRYASTSSAADGQYSDGVKKFKTTLLLSSFGQPGEPRRIDETAGFFDIAGFTQSGDWLLYWMSPEMSASIQADGLNLYAASATAGRPRKLGVVTLVHPDMVSVSPTKDVIAVTSGSGRETWANKAIAIIDLAAAGGPAVSYLTEPSVSAQFPAWSPDGEKLAWCTGPDADALNKRQLLARGQKTIKVIDPATGVPKEIPLTPGLSLGAPADVEDQCVRLRRIWTAEIGPRGRILQLTNDPRHFDEKPLWSGDGSHILFCRMDAQDAKTVWLMRNDGSELRQVAGPLRPPPDLTKLEKLSDFGYYGYTDWRSLFDWWRG